MEYRDQTAPQPLVKAAILPSLIGEIREEINGLAHCQIETAQHLCRLLNPRPVAADASKASNPPASDTIEGSLTDILRNLRGIREAMQDDCNRLNTAI